MTSERESVESAGNDLLLEFKEYINIFGRNISMGNEWINMRKIAHACGINPYNPMEEELWVLRVLCYLLGREYTAGVAQDPVISRSILKFEIFDPTWLKLLCRGLALNRSVESLHIHQIFSVDLSMDSQIKHQQQMAECLQEIPLLLEQSSSLTCLHIYSNIYLNSYEHIAEAVRTNKLHELSLSLWISPYDTQARRAEPGSSTGELNFQSDSDSDLESGLDSSTSRPKGQMIADALLQNTSIRRLQIVALPSILNNILPSFIGQNSSAAVEDLTLLYHSSILNFSSDHSSDILKALVAVLSTNQTLRKIKLVNFAFSLDRWMKVLEALKPNMHLQVLDIGESTGWVHVDFLNAMVNLLRVHCTQIIDLGIKAVGETSTVFSKTSEVLKENLPALNHQLHLNSDYGRVLFTAEKVPPRSARVILCGPGYAGKTTLCNTMMNSVKSKRRASLFLQRNPSLWLFLYGTAALEELEKRTRGVEMQIWREDSSEHPRICLWDFADQREYYALHDYMFPVVNCANLFLFCLSLIPSPVDTSMQSKCNPERIRQIEKEFRFLCSNTQEKNNSKPRVFIVLTNVDRVPFNDLERIRLQCEVKLEEAFEAFETRVDLVRPFFFLNCHSRNMVRELEASILNAFAEMIPKLDPSTKSVKPYVGSWKTRTLGLPPIITLEDYDKICIQVDETMLRSRNLLDVFDKNSPPVWKGVVGWFQASPKSRRLKIDLENGFVKEQGFKLLLEHSLTCRTSSATLRPLYLAKDLIDILLVLEICFKDRGGYHIPAALDDGSDLAFLGRQQLQWNAVADGEMYIGRRLQCANDKITFFTSGFFPQLQVVLQKHLLKAGIIGGKGFDGFEIQQNMLTFVYSGMNVFIEHGDGECFDHSFVDVLVKTSRGFKETVHFIEVHVLTVIRDFCAQPEEESYALAAIRGEEFFSKFEKEAIADAQVFSSAFQQLKEPIWAAVLTNLLGKQILQDTPKLVYLLEDKNIYLFRGRKEVRLRLHLQCESREGPHVVDKQKGRSFVVEDELRETMIPVVKWTYDLLKLAAGAAGKVLVGADLTPW
ncbi:hypothetical protein R1sor_016479 [Riccia sorocarpa]|uniref:Uncharacterized protein n=1 Tax=Riccia sorocarpa TaxID=122646 RepID=A0ABD3HJ77_9MARC